MLNRQKLREEMFRNNIRGVDLARILNVSPITISRYVNGARSPKRMHLIALSRALHTTPEYLTDMEIPEDPQHAYEQVKTMINTHKSDWNYKQKTELVNTLLNT